MQKKSKSVWSFKISWKLYFECLAWGAAIEAPLLAWLLSVKDEFHVSIIPHLLFLVHIPGYLLTYPLLVSLHHLISNTAENRIGYSLLFFFRRF